ncbi:hypothetical protein Tco_0357896, partial [Tanacetum coccineum]
SSDEEDEANVGKDKDDDDDDDNDDEQTESDNDDEDFVHPKFTTHDDEARKKRNDDYNDDEIKGANVVGEEMDEEATNAEGEENKSYRDVNVNLEGRDTVITPCVFKSLTTTINLLFIFYIVRICSKS